MMPRLLDTVTPGDRAIFIFSGESDLKFLKLLKPGFRHCCLMIEANQYWIFYNPMSHVTTMRIYSGLSLDEIVSWFHRCGHTVVCCRVSVPRNFDVSVRPYTCVEAVKRLLGMTAPRVVTPWQLFRSLTEVGK